MVRGQIQPQLQTAPSYSGLMAAALSGSTTGFGTLGVLRADAVTFQMGKNAAAI